MLARTALALSIAVLLCQAPLGGQETSKSENDVVLVRRS